MKIILTFFLCLIVQFALAQNSIQKGQITLKNGLVISYEASLGQPQNPTFLFLPGVYRGFTSDDEFIKQLTKTNTNWVSFHYSLQPASHIFVKKVNPYSLFEKITLQELSQEPLLVAQYLKIQKPIFVSISYSSVVTSAWNNLNVPWLIETSPMGRYDEQNPGFSAYGLAWENWMKLIPFWGTAAVSTTKDIAYYNYWTAMVHGLKISKPELKNTYFFNQTVAAYVKLSKLAEGFDFRKQNFIKSPKRIYILGEREDSYRLQLQKEAIVLNQKQTGQGNYIFLIKDAGHLIPADAPLAYLQALHTIYSGKLPTDKALAIVSKDGKILWQ